MPCRWQYSTSFFSRRGLVWATNQSTSDTPTEDSANGSPSQPKADTQRHPNRIESRPARPPDWFTSPCAGREPRGMAWQANETLASLTRQIRIAPEQPNKELP